MTRKARLEGAATEPAPTATPEHIALAVIVEQFQREHADLWEAIKLGPTHYGLQQMIEALGK